MRWSLVGPVAMRGVRSQCLTVVKSHVLSSGLMRAAGIRTRTQKSRPPEGVLGGRRATPAPERWHLSAHDLQGFLEGFCIQACTLCLRMKRLGGEPAIPHVWPIAGRDVALRELC